MVSIRPLLVLAVLATAVSTLQAQGLTGAAITGRVSTAGDAPVAGASLTLTNTASGVVRRAESAHNGRYAFEVLPIAGLYRIEVRSLGFAAATIDSISLGLGDRVTRNIILSPAAVAALSAVVVRSDQLRDPGLGGPSHSLPRSAVQDIPLLSRSILGLIAMSPQATGSALALGGQHARFSAIQLDGGIASDLMGLNATPGSGIGARALSTESIEALRIIVAPFDVRHGGFAGGLVNAVTRSGTNRMSGSLLTSVATENLAGADPQGSNAPPFTTVHYAGSIGGPIVRDRLHFFLAADVQSSKSPFLGPKVSDASTGISDSTARRAAAVFRDVYGFDAGGPEEPVLLDPNSNIFAKVSWQPSTTHMLELSHIRLRARKDILSRVLRNRPDRDAWQLSGSGSATRVASETGRLRATSAWRSLSNELIAGASSVRSRSAPELRMPLFLVEGDVSGNYLAGGSIKSSQADIDQRVFEFTDNLSWITGEHTLTAGVQYQHIDIRDNLFIGAWGVWTFAGVDELENMQPLRYEVSLPLREGGPLAEFDAPEFAVYVQDKWNVTPRLSVTAGLRADIPYFNSPVRNTTLHSSEVLGNVDTRAMPSGNAVISPRIGFALEIGAQREWLLRGGFGGFTARPPLAWFSQAYFSTGTEQTLLVCTSSDGVPSPTTDIGNLPDRCLNNQSPGSVVPTITYFSPSFKFPQARKIAIGLDRELATGVTLSIDAVRTTTHHSLFADDINLLQQPANAEGRVMYGTIASTGTARPTRLDSVNFGGVMRLGNASADHATSLSATVEKRWSGGGFLQLGYNWSKSEDVTSMSGFTGVFLLQQNPLDGTLRQRNLRRSTRDIPHTFVAAGVFPLRSGTVMSFLFRARSGNPFSYTIAGDANADGIRSNDLFYVPVDADDITLANPASYPALEAFIESQECLRSNRTRVMHRTSCRNPAVYSLDLRAAQSVWRKQGHRVEITADLLNATNFLNRRWGLVRGPTVNERADFLNVRGWDATNDRPIYEVPELNGSAILPDPRGAAPEDSRWRLQLGARVLF